MTPSTGEALRCDRYTSFAIDVAALVVVTLVTRKLLINDDHMIWNYRRQLEAVAEARSKAAG
ncbi:MAG: hypothetical protein ABSE67_13605 [Xanthobacteraceae bacterium]